MTLGEALELHSANITDRARWYVKAFAANGTSVECSIETFFPSHWSHSDSQLQDDDEVITTVTDVDIPWWEGVNGLSIHILRPMELIDGHTESRCAGI